MISSASAEAVSSQAVLTGSAGAKLISLFQKCAGFFSFEQGQRALRSERHLVFGQFQI